MKKYLITLCILAWGLSPGWAQQNAIKGTVVNQRDEPIANAKVEVPFSRKVTRTNPQGMFTIPVKKMPTRIRVSSDGKATLLLRPGEDMFIRMRDRETANWNPENRHFFMGLTGNFIYSPGGSYDPYGNQRDGITSHTLGLMVGVMDNYIGAYVKGHFIPLNDGDDDFEIRSRRDVYDFVLGGMVHIWKPIYLNVGGGAMFFTERSNHFSAFGVPAATTQENLVKGIMDIGLMLRYNHFMFNAGVLTSFHKYDWHPSVGFSYIF
ncbi:MAG: carboxypeptidase regulatory-like domain-containing protein [Bacteroidaceae bacterium]|nr:carboxypeptidase regulatory-like domain-containing protein [Bacteroidaceae bacterium]